MVVLRAICTESLEAKFGDLTAFHLKPVSNEMVFVDVEATLDTLIMTDNENPLATDTRPLSAESEVQKLAIAFENPSFPVEDFAEVPKFEPTKKLILCAKIGRLTFDKVDKTLISCEQASVKVAVTSCEDDIVSRIDMPCPTGYLAMIDESDNHKVNSHTEYPSLTTLLASKEPIPYPVKRNFEGRAAPEFSRVSADTVGESRDMTVVIDPKLMADVTEIEGTNIKAGLALQNIRQSDIHSEDSQDDTPTFPEGERETTPKSVP